MPAGLWYNSHEVMIMRGTTVQRVFGGIKADLYLPPKSLTAAPCRLVLVGDGRSLFDILPQVLSPLEEKMAAAGQGLVLVGLDSGEQRDADYTPWPARGFDVTIRTFPARRTTTSAGWTRCCCPPCGRNCR